MGRTVRNRKRALISILSFFFISCVQGVQAAPVVLFTDDFESEAVTILTSHLNYSAFENWNVVDGAVDLIYSPNFGIECAGTGRWCVDLDGTTNNAGRLESRSVFTLSPGITYTLTFDISGNQRNAGTDSMTFGLTDGATDIFSDTIIKAGTDPFETVTRYVTVASATNAVLFFDHAGGDQFGMILDNVTLTAIPVPAAIWLFGSGLLGLVVVSRHKKTA